MDDEGLVPESLQSILSSWDVAARGSRKPFLLYTVPTGQNPTGTTMGVERRKTIYDIAQKEDLIIVEDDPYYFLQMPPYIGEEATALASRPSHKKSLTSSLPSFLSLDVDGRVVRLESFSKIISPGSRTGWLTATQQLVDRFIKHSECSTQCPSGISQLVLFKLLDEHCGHAGFFDWLIHLRLEYKQRRDTLIRACEKYLDRSVASWRPPAAGMFLWINIDWHKHPDAQLANARMAIEEAIYRTAVDNGVLIFRGS
ncbi:Aromatic amino acid aminotransferase C56E4.03 [Exophiala dermatitidis]